eukprot:c25485_g1_i1 orf=452-697(+)
MQSIPIFTFANQAGLEMLETTSVALPEVSWEKTLDEDEIKNMGSVFNQVLQQVFFSHTNSFWHTLWESTQRALFQFLLVHS